jgi:hypothetical protein
MGDSNKPKMAAPEGFRPIWIQAKNYGIYLLGGGDVPTPNYVVLKKADILADIDKYGFMNDFNDYKIELKKFKGEVSLTAYAIACHLFIESQSAMKHLFNASKALLT